MTHLGDSAMLFCYGDQRVGLGQGERQRLLDEYVDATLHEFAGGCQVSDGGYGNAHGLYRRARDEHVTYGAESLASELGCYGLGSGEICIDYGREFYALIG
jgi:hypothetical protein